VSGVLPVQVFEQSIYIQAAPERVDQTITDPILMHRWLNPLLRCESIGPWRVELGSQFRFLIKIPLWQPALLATVQTRQPGLVIWSFTGFFEGQDRWECQPEGSGTRLLNRFEFKIGNPLVAFGFNTFAAQLTRQDMQAQLQRLKQVAEAGLG
jgi:carbon monoxide dehydrogenase subunit G